MSAEREVSLSTGAGFEQALKELGYPYEVIDCGEDFLEKIVACKKKFNPEVALIALHGKYAEDGIVQSICEYLKIRYSGSGVLGSALCMDKIVAAQMLSDNDIPTPKYQTLTLERNLVAKSGDTAIDAQIAQFKLELPLPVVVKPAREGSSVGVTIVKERRDFIPAMKYAAQHDSFLIIEKFIAGMELTIPIFDGQILEPIEIVPKVDFYDYKNKYTAGRTEYIMPARLSEKTLQRAKDLALRAFNVCRLRTYARIDFRVELAPGANDGTPYIIDINTLPGCTPTSLLPKSAKHSGLSFNDVIEKLVETASLDYLGVK